MWFVAYAANALLILAISKDHLLYELQSLLAMPVIAWLPPDYLLGDVFCQMVRLCGSRGLYVMLPEAVFGRFAKLARALLKLG